MADDETGTFQAGQTGLVIRIPEAEPGALYLVPEPDAPLRRLTEAIADRWPEAPPYGGRFTQVIPHLTIAQGQEDAVLDEIEADLRD